MDSTKPLRDNLDDYKKINLELKSLGETIGDNNETFILLNSLPEAYKEMKNALKYGRESIIIDVIISVLKTKEMEPQS